jgi:hypothetical protein
MLERRRASRTGMTNGMYSGYRKLDRPPQQEQHAPDGCRGVLVVR